MQSVILTIIIVPQLPQFCVNVLSYKYIRFFETSDELFIQGQTRRVTIFRLLFNPRLNQICYAKACKFAPT